MGEGGGKTREDAVGMETGSKTGSGTGEGLERASATTFSIPGTRTIELVNSAKKARWHCCWVDQGGETLNKARVRGLWSVKIVNSLPFKRKRKCQREE